MIGSGNITHITTKYSKNDHNKNDNKFTDIVTYQALSYVTNSLSVLEQIEYLKEVKKPKNVYLYINEQCDLLVLENRSEMIVNSEYLSVDNIEIVFEMSGKIENQFVFLGKTKNNYHCFISYTKDEDGLDCSWWILSKDKEKLFNHFCKLYRINCKDILTARLNEELQQKNNKCSQPKL